MLWLKLNWVSIGDSSCGLDSLIVVSRLSPAIPWGPGLSAAVLRAQDPRPDVSARCLLPSIGRTVYLPSIGRTFIRLTHFGSYFPLWTFHNRAQGPALGLRTDIWFRIMFDKRRL